MLCAGCNKEDDKSTSGPSENTTSSSEIIPGDTIFPTPLDQNIRLGFFGTINNDFFDWVHSASNKDNWKIGLTFTTIDTLIKDAKSFENAIGATLINTENINAVISSFSQIAEVYKHDETLYLAVAWQYGDNKENFGLFLWKNLAEHDYLRSALVDSFLSCGPKEYVLMKNSQLRETLSSIFGINDDNELSKLLIYYNNAINVEKPMINKQSDDETVFMNDLLTLHVEATVKFGELSYQWYDAKSGQPIRDALSSKFDVDTSKPGEFEFYVIVTNTVQESTNVIRSGNITIIVEKPAEKPSISVSPSSVETFVGKKEIKLTAIASVNDGGKLSYQWYDAKSGQPIRDALSNEFDVDAGKPGEFEFYVIATNTIVIMGTKKNTTESHSDVIKVTIKGTAEKPSVSVSPNTHTYIGIDVELTATASVNDGGKLSYQWYDNDNGLIKGATNPTYKVKADKEEERRFYVIVKNTNSKAAEPAENKSDIIHVNIFSADFGGIVETWLEGLPDTPIGNVNIICPFRAFFRRNIEKFTTGDKEYDQNMQKNDQNIPKNNEKPDDDSEQITKIINIVNDYILIANSKVTNICIMGHVDLKDSKASDADNERLALLRAKRVQRVMEDLGVNIPIQITTNLDQNIDDTPIGRQSATIILYGVETDSK